MMQNQSVVLSAMRPTGELHLGNLEVLKFWVDFQNHGHQCFFFSADYHAETTSANGLLELKDNIIVTSAEFMAAGIDPEKSVLFIQSQVPELAELHLILSNLITVPRLARNPVYKEQIKQLKLENPTYLFLGYPVMQAADILLYKGEHVPIGEDQLPHLEITRELAITFNKKYGNVFPVPKPKVISIPRVPGIDGRKMSKSYGNQVDIGDTEEATREKISKMVTDPARARREDLGHPEVCPVFCLQRIYNLAKIDEIEVKCKTAAMGCTDCKAMLADSVNSSLLGIREHRKELLCDKEHIVKVMKKGCERAREKASETIKEVRKVIRPDF